MGDRTTCQLANSSQIAEADLPKLIKAIEDASYCDFNTPDIEAALRRGEAWFVFYEMNWGEMENELDEALKSLGLSYCWNWDAGGGYGAGVCLYNAETGETGRFECHDAEMVIRVDDLDDPDKVADVLNWRAFEKSTGRLEIIAAGQGACPAVSAPKGGAGQLEARP